MTIPDGQTSATFVVTGAAQSAGVQVSATVGPIVVSTTAVVSGF